MYLIRCIVRGTSLLSTSEKSPVSPCNTLITTDIGEPWKTWLREYVKQSSKTDTTFHYCWRVKSSFILVWMESTTWFISLIGYSLKWRCCSLVWPKYLWSKTGFDRPGRDQESFRLLAQYFSYITVLTYTVPLPNPRRLYNPIVACFIRAVRNNGLYHTAPLHTTSARNI
jgi:hypothetical protein